METLNRKKFLKLVGLASIGVLISELNATSIPFSGNDGKLFSPEPLRVAHLTDIHIQNGLEPERGFASCLNAVNSLPHKPDLIINGGDAIMNSALTFSKEKVNKQWELFHALLKSDNSITVKHCIGNHDLVGWPVAKCSEAESKFRAMDEYSISKPYYSFTKGKWKFIVLDSIQCKNSIPGYSARLDSVQMIWLEEELKDTPPDFFICIVSHVPILAICTLFDTTFSNKKHRTVPDNLLHGDAAELTNLFYRYPNVKACLSGHIHMIDHVNYLGVDYFCNGAVSGSWWKGNHHQFPPSFSMMNFFEDGKVAREVNYYDVKDAALISKIN
ncbi:metallophosphoesterase family protein [Aurantibacillus circumpalustris]|uniref:metallophosphoesterase family protein n=1 Tax=Aurantibacillus circumpalustris TaxID=3036359 RepID=UPI00295BDAED|nr:metallophosphoesterase [Aurantibacillus circumpalustris]